MVSQSYMDTISTISFWTLTICRFTGWWVTIDVTISFSCMRVNNLIFTIFAVQEVKFFNNGWKRKVWMRQFLLHETMSLITIFCLPPQQFSWRKQLRRQSLFLRQEETMMANIEVPEYKSLPCLPWGSTISMWNNRTKVYNVQDNELNKRILLPKNCQQSWTSLFPEDKMFWFTVVTTDEFNAMAQDGVPQFFNGGLRSQGGWQQLVFCPLWKRHYVSQLITCLRNTWPAQWKQWW